jgi:putative transposase
MMPLISPDVKLSVQDQLRLLGIPRSSYYWVRKQPTVRLADPLEMDLRSQIQGICLDNSCYGYRRVTEELHHRGLWVNHKCVKRLMKEDNLLCLRKKAFVIYTTDSRHGFKVYPNLAREMILTDVNQLWVADITYIRLMREFIYLAAILDAFSRRLIGWQLSRKVDAALTVAALQMALTERMKTGADLTGLIHHSDRGVQYACGDYVQHLTDHRIQISMSRKGNPYDNAKAESFMKTLKQEEVYLNEYDSFDDARANLDRFLDCYNHRRLHSSIGYLAPAIFETNSKQSLMSSTLTTAFSVQ